MLLSVLLGMAQQMASLAASLASSSHTDCSEQALLRCRDNRSSPQAPPAPSIDIHPSEGCVRVRGCGCALVTFCLFWYLMAVSEIKPHFGDLISCFQAAFIPLF